MALVFWSERAREARRDAVKTAFKILGVLLVGGAALFWLERARPQEVQAAATCSSG